MGHWGTFAPPSTSNSSLWSKSDSQLSKYCVVCEISWCRCQQLVALSISTALIVKLLVIGKLLHPTLKCTVSVPWHNFYLCPSSQQNLATPLFSCLVFCIPCLLYVIRDISLHWRRSGGDWTVSERFFLFLSDWKSRPKFLLLHFCGFRLHTNQLSSVNIRLKREACQNAGQHNDAQ